MSRHHDDKEYSNRLPLRTENHGLHWEQLGAEDESDPTHGDCRLRLVGTGAAAHQAHSDGNRDYDLGLRQVEGYLDRQTK